MTEMRIECAFHTAYVFSLSPPLSLPAFTRAQPSTFIFSSLLIRLFIPATLSLEHCTRQILCGSKLAPGDVFIRLVPEGGSGGDVARVTGQKKKKKLSTTVKTKKQDHE